MSLMQMFRLDTLPSAAGTSTLFNGSVLVSPLPFDGALTLTSVLSGGFVTFQPRARSRWHSHPAGQLLLISDGEGIVQQQDHAPLLMQPGYAVWAPPNLTHWHGAGVRRTVSHTAILEVVDGVNAYIGADVSDDEYLAAVNQLGIGQSSGASSHAPAVAGVLVPLLLVMLLLLFGFMWRRRRNKAAATKEALHDSAEDSSSAGRSEYVHSSASGWRT